jgi:inner membrane protein
MDTVTHALFGALASQAVTNNSQSENDSSGKYVPVTVAAIAAAFPDSDYLLFLIDPLVFLAEWHRSFTHSLVLLPLWTILLTGIIVLLFPGLRKRRLLISGFVVLGLASHILLDLLTVYGTRIFYPLSYRTFSLGTTFVIDPYLSLIVCIGLLMAFVRASRFMAMVSIAILCVYVLFQLHLKSQARLMGEILSPQNDVSDIKTIALPQPFSPFHWRIINYENSRYYTALIDLAGISEKLKHLEGTIPYLDLVSAYQDVANIEWEEYTLFGDQPEGQSLAREVWQHKKMTKFRNFARYPVLYRINLDDNQTCVWFSDLRYHISKTIPSFRYGMCRENNQEWRRYRLRYFSRNKRHLID